MKKVFLIIFILILIMPSGVIFADESNAVKSYKGATEYDFPPFSITENGVADGFSVELLNAVADEVGIKIDFKIDNWETIKAELEQGKLDVLPCVAYSEERDDTLDFTAPYLVLHGNIFVRDDNETILSEEDLYDKEIIVVKNSAPHDYALKKGFTESLITTDTLSDAFELLSSGAHDAVLAQNITGNQLLNSLDITNIKPATTLDNDGITQITTELEGFEVKICFAVQEGDDELLSALNEGLAIVLANGTFMTLYQKWFSFLEDTSTLGEKVRTSLVIIIPFILLIMLFAIIYVERLISRKTAKLKEAQSAILSMEAGIRNKQKLESIGTLASGIAHEINNPINGIMNYGQLILDTKNNDEEVNHYASEIIDEAQRIADITKSLLQFSRQDKQGYSKASMSDIIQRTLSLTESIFNKEQIKLNVDIPDDLPEINCRHQQIQQVLMNLLTNARDALNDKYPNYHENKQITIKCRLIIKDNKRYIRTTIQDTGDGIPKRVQDKMFDPFFSTKSKDKRTGLGLSISYGIVEEHRGHLNFITKAGAYTSFNLDLLTTDQ